MFLVVRRSCTSRLLYTRSSLRYLSGNRYSHRNKNNDNDDAIEAEVVCDKTIGGSDSQASSSGWFSRISSTLAKGFNKAKEIVGMDDKSIHRRQEKKELDAIFDRVFAGNYILGKFVKIGAHMLTKSFQQASDDMDVIRANTEISLTNDHRFRKLLESNSFFKAENIRCVPFSTSIVSKHEKQGKASRKYSVSMHVLHGESAVASTPLQSNQGTLLGSVSVEVVIDDTSGLSSNCDDIRIISMLFQDEATGTTWEVDHSNSPKITEIRI